MQILGVRVLLKPIKGGDFRVLLGLTGPDNLRVAVLLRLLEGLVTPRSGDEVVDGVLGVAEVEREGGELGGGAALEEEDGVVGRDVEEEAEIGFGFLDDGEELFAAVAHLHDAHAGSAPVVEVGLGFEEDVLG